jgi:hypothetical protein
LAGFFPIDLRGVILRERHRFSLLWRRLAFMRYGSIRDSDGTGLWRDRVP